MLALREIGLCAAKPLEEVVRILNARVDMSHTALPSSPAIQLMCDLVSGIARSLADEPDHIRVESDSTESETVLRLFVSESDLGKLIGKQGRTARSLRTIVSAAGNKLQGRFALDIRSIE